MNTKEAYGRLLSTLESAQKQARALAQEGPTNIHRALEEPVRECRSKLQRFEYAAERAKARNAAERAEAAKATAESETPEGEQKDAKIAKAGKNQ